MDVISKQWSAEETNCLHALWSSAKIHNKLEGALRTKTIFQQLQGEMATVGFDRNVVEINSKPKKVPASKAGRAEMNTDVYSDVITWLSKSIGSYKKPAPATAQNHSFMALSLSVSLLFLLHSVITPSLCPFLLFS